MGGFSVGDGSSWPHFFAIVPFEELWLNSCLKFFQSEFQIWPSLGFQIECILGRKMCVLDVIN